ncbi:MAG: hypothetical protein CM15mP69_4700 [Ectothiorhodospiraceae bacterium]|nr:MAG: hypothetical protein CM15mP69_4700 [Ectothiorhodospiraceae bacterium]
MQNLIMEIIKEILRLRDERLYIDTRQMKVIITDPSMMTNKSKKNLKLLPKSYKINENLNNILLRQFPLNIK